MSAQHTPGPWSVLKSDTVPDNHWCVAACGGSADGSGTKVLVVAPIQDYCMGAEDDASLIAAAPELLLALEQAVTSMQDSGYQNSHIAVRAARAAIAKARGHDG